MLAFSLVSILTSNVDVMDIMSWISILTLSK